MWVDGFFKEIAPPNSVEDTALEILDQIGLYSNISLSHLEKKHLVIHLLHLIRAVIQEEFQTQE